MSEWNETIAILIATVALNVLFFLALKILSKYVFRYPFRFELFSLTLIFLTVVALIGSIFLICLQNHVCEMNDFGPLKMLLIPFELVILFPFILGFLARRKKPYKTRKALFVAFAGIFDVFVWLIFGMFQRAEVVQEIGFNIVLGLSLSIAWVGAVSFISASYIGSKLGSSR